MKEPQGRTAYRGIDMSSWQLICFLCGQGIATAIRIWLEERLHLTKTLIEEIIRK